MRCHGAFCLAFVSVIAGCSVMRPGADPIHEQRYAARYLTASGQDSARDSAVIVQVRDYDRSGAVAVVAWDADDPEYGLRSDVSRNGGQILGEPTFGHHELYVSPTLVQHMGGFRLAAVLPGLALVPARPTRDVYSCYYGAHCSPMTSVGVWLPDSVLRAHNDSLVVTFVPPMGERWTLSLSADLITRYLHAVDSVSAKLAREAKTAQN